MPGWIPGQRFLLTFRRPPRGFDSENVPAFEAGTHRRRFDYRELLRLKAATAVVTALQGSG